MSRTSKTRFAYKLDRLFWFIIMLLPILLYALINYRNPSAGNFFEYISAFSPFPFIEEMFSDVLVKVFGGDFALTPYLAYVVGVEIVHVLFDVIVFIPRLAHKWVGKAVQND